MHLLSAGVLLPLSDSKEQDTGYTPMNDDIQQIHIDIESATEQAALGAAVTRLMKNKDFKKVILDGLFKNEAVRLVLLKGDPSMQSDEAQKELLKQMDGIGSLRQYLYAMEMLGKRAAGAIEDYQEELETLRNEA